MGEVADTKQAPRESDAITVLASGADEGPAFVFFHGCPGSGEDWSAVVRRVPAARALRTELPDHGTAPESDLDPFALEELAVELVASLPRGSTLIGSSFGAWVAARTAARLPNHVRHVVLVGGFAELSEEAAEMRRGLRNQLEEGTLSPLGLADACEQLFLGAAVQGEERERIRRELRSISRAQWVRHLERAIALARPEAAVPSFEATATVVHATHDAAVPLELGRALAARARSAQLVTIDTDAHLLCVAAPERMAALVFRERGDDA